MKYQMTQADRDWLLKLVDRPPGMCSQTERTVCKSIVERMVEIPESVERTDGGVLCSDGFIRYPNGPSLLGYD